jgi:hypothetical protein
MTVKAAHENAVSSRTWRVLRLWRLRHSPHHSIDAFASPLTPTTGQHGMNPKHFHTPVSTRLRCPVCHQPVYSRGGIHPQCAMRQSEPPTSKIDKPKISIPGGDGAVAVIVDAVPVIQPGAVDPEHIV